jgi:pyrimidine-nucleoside phosphorylase
LTFSEIIVRKRDGQSLSQKDIETFVHGASCGTVPAEQLAALLMAICWQGMNEEETRALTLAMLRSGELWDIGAEVPGAVDKHSTGGVGDTVSLIFAPLLAAVDVPVAMMAGRGLGHTQGTLDKLDAIPGMRCDYDRRGLLDLLASSGAGIIAQTDTIAPADRRLYALRDVTGTVPSLPLIVGSIMSKKLALGASRLVLDVKCGSGAFRTTRESAIELATALRGVGRELGVEVEALVTDMNQPLGPSLGTACEVREALEVLSGRGDRRLREVTLRLAVEALKLGGTDAVKGRKQLEDALDNGSAMAAWNQLVEAQGGDPDPNALARPRREVEVEAGAQGVVSGIAGDRLGWCAVELGAGRRNVDDEIDHRAGLRVLVRIGDRIESGQPLARLFIGDRKVDESALIDKVRGVFELGNHEVNQPDLILGALDDLVGEPVLP